MGDTRVTAHELQTFMFKAASMANEVQLSIGAPRADGTFPVITPNNLLIGRLGIFLPDDTELAEGLPYKDRYQIVNQMTNAFLSKWSVEATPKLVHRQKWHSGTVRQLRLGDLVCVADKTAVKAKYRLAIVAGLNTSTDGVVRSADLTYHSPGVGMKTTKGAPVTISRSVQRLALILGKEEQDVPLDVIEGLGCSIVTEGAPVTAGVPVEEKDVESQ